MKVAANNDSRSLTYATQAHAGFNNKLFFSLLFLLNLMRNPVLFCQFLSLLLLISSVAPAQHASLIGHIIDAKTQKPVPYANVRLREDGALSLSGKGGRFLLNIPDKDDSLLITIPGYQSKAVAWQKGMRDSLLIEIEPIHLLPEPIHTDYPSWNVRKLTLGARAKKPGQGMVQGTSGSQYAFMVKNEKGKKLGYIRSVSFYIGEDGHPREPFRVRLYKANGPANAPGADLLNESVVAAAPAGGQWFTIDLTAYNISAPQEGFYVAMEWVSNCPIFNGLGPYTTCGQVMHPTFEFRESFTWNYTYGRGWSQITLANRKNRYNAMMRAEVVAAK